MVINVPFSSLVSMGTVRRSGVVDTYILLLAITLLGSYMILFNTPPPSPEVDSPPDEAELWRQIDDTSNRIFQIEYYPVFEKHYSRFFKSPLKKSKRMVNGGGESPNSKERFS